MDDEHKFWLLWWLEAFVTLVLVVGIVRFT